MIYRVIVWVVIFGRYFIYNVKLIWWKVRLIILNLCIGSINIKCIVFGDKKGKFFRGFFVGSFEFLVM